MHSKRFVVVHWGVRRGLSRHHAMEIEISKRHKGLEIFVRNHIYLKALLIILTCNVSCPEPFSKRHHRSCILVRALV